MIKIYLSEILGRKKLTQLYIVKKTGIRPGTVNAYYHEFIKHVNLDHLNKMCEVLGCRLDELIEYIPDDKK